MNRQGKSKDPGQLKEAEPAKRTEKCPVRQEKAIEIKSISVLILNTYKEILLKIILLYIIEYFRDVVLYQHNG